MSQVRVAARLDGRLRQRWRTAGSSPGVPRSRREQLAIVVRSPGRVSWSRPDSVGGFLCSQNGRSIYLGHRASSGTLEHHLWHSTLERLDQPDWLALDLDPGESSWKDVLRLALVVRDVFKRRSLRGFPKTSGSRGIHIYLPPSRASWPGRSWAKPPRWRPSNVRRPSAAKAKIYVDWLQNARGKTLAAPFTVRARPGGPVSMPLSWKDVEDGVGIQDFTLRQARQLTGEGWRDFFSHRHSLPR
ncbi:MAG TPA: hypothetical protein VMU54_13705 [Planctomycetota bacterium]|nr:hypothetical protein [Planctomycetota bacterium]